MPAVLVSDCFSVPVRQLLMLLLLLYVHRNHKAYQGRASYAVCTIPFFATSYWRGWVRPRDLDHCALRPMLGPSAATLVVSRVHCLQPYNCDTGPLVRWRWWWWWFLLLLLLLLWGVGGGEREREKRMFICRPVTNYIDILAGGRGMFFSPSSTLCILPPSQTPSFYCLSLTQSTNNHIHILIYFTENQTSLVKSLLLPMSAAYVQGQCKLQRNSHRIEVRKPYQVLSLSVYV